MKKAMISQPMDSISNDEIQAVRERALSALKDNGYSFVNTMFTGDGFDERVMITCGVEYPSIYFLSKTLECMSHCHAVYFCKGWDSSRGCVIEHDIAEVHGLEIIYEE